MFSDIWNAVSTWFLDNSPYFWVGLIFIAVFLVLFRLSWSAMAGFDVAWDLQRFREKHRRSSWNKATSRRYSWLGLGLPLYAAWVIGIVTLIASGFDLRVYLGLATLWLITTPLRNFWLIAIVRKVDAKRGRPHTISWWEEVTRYYEDATYRPERESHEPWFDGRLKFLNIFQSLRLIFLIFSFWGIFGIIVQMIVSIVWPVSAACAIFYYLRQVEDYDDRRAWWRYTRYYRSDLPYEVLPIASV